MKILIVEDDPGSRRLVKLRLLAAGHKVVETENGQTAWDLFQQEPFQMVITDWMMPKLDGPGLIHNIRSSAQTSYTYIIMLTAVDDKPNVVMGLEAGADEYLTKPFDSKELIARVASGERVLKLEKELTQAHRQMEILAMQDVLTGIFNRRAIEEHARVEFEHARRNESPFSVIFLDIDHFKAINDQHGHSVGDHTLHQLAEILSKNLRQYDRIGRWGGEEFVVILPDTKISEAIAIAERMRVAIAETKFSLENGKYYEVQISLGVACATRSYPSLAKLIDVADQAMYQAKQAGRNRVCSFDQSIESSTTTKGGGLE
ncbi:MAG: diguanylate cyclase [Anaerolineales bacterium]|nr:diguanylate cyclase [Anaerolineales bacterium]